MTETLSYEVRRVRGDDEMQAALELRHEVFCVEQGVPEREELDGRDREGIHLVAVVDGELRRPRAGCCSSGTTAQFSRLAVRRRRAGAGIATALLELADAETRAAGARRLVLHAQTYARELYERAGYRARGAGCSWRPGSSTSRWRSSCVTAWHRGARDPASTR